MKLGDIVKLYQDHPEIDQFGTLVKASEGDKFKISGTSASIPPFMIAALYRHVHRNTVVVLNDREEALYFLNDLQSLMPRKDILFFPASYKRPYQLEEIDNANVLQRAEVLNQLNHTQSGRQMIVTFAEALCEKVINKRSLVKNTLDLKVGDDCGMDFVVDVLEEYQFEREDFVYEPGQYSVRGGILDVFSFAHDHPYRIEFFGNDVEMIREFDPVDQLSVKDVSTVSLIPNIQKNFLTEEKVDFLDYISPQSVLLIQSPEFVQADLNKHFERAEAHFSKRNESTGGGTVLLEPKELYTSGDIFTGQIEKFSCIEFGSRKYFKKLAGSLEWESSAQPSFKKEFDLLGEHLEQNADLGIRNFIISENDKQVQRLEEIFETIEPNVDIQNISGSIHGGFLDSKLQIACYTDHQIFERYHKYKNRTQSSRSQALTLKELQELIPGDFVTHVHHGIGKFAGLHKIKVGPNEQEAVKIIYRDGDAIFVNVNSLYKISKYSGKEGTEPKLNKIGSKEWSRAKSKTKTRVKELAFDLISLYAKRKSQKGFAFSPDSYLQQELEASFIYIDTPDQEKCTDDVKRDMEEPHPMDRLVCGDVGFGKTEIAVRAAFKAACDGKQVAILVPTTILAIQHYYTFKDRLKDFPVDIDYLNRFKSTAQQKETIKKLAEGKIDIIIGTHRLVSKDVKFKDLGLMVIDEEQKFGVGVKEKLKTIKVSVDTLTLTATPIPRTLQFSLMGVRDLSILGTPPPNRQPVETVIASLDQEMIRDAVSYELKRGGQVFFVHNRILDLPEIGSMIQKLVPDARVGVIHGQMPGSKVESKMKDFIEGGFDVLLCTTIIESGLDIPNANTIIINQAQNYGLSDLHQMRGRVGRSNRKAFCYLIAPHESVLSRDAQKRLKAMEEFSDLGSGFHISMRDLDIRGAGDLLGPEQSGFISEIGYDMYHRILNEAMLELKEEFYPELFKEELAKKRAQFVEDTQVDTDLAILIPHHYIPSISERLTFYNRIASSETETDLRNISKEMIDRFGPIPQEVLGLIDCVRIREVGKQLGIEKVVLKGEVLRLYFVGDKTSKFYASKEFVQLLSYVQLKSGSVKLKESEKYLSLIIQPIKGIKEVYFKLQEILDNIHQKEPAHES